MLRSIKWLLASVIVSTVSPAVVVSQAKYLRVSADTAAIHVAPKLSSQVVSKARIGDVFQLGGKTGGWFEIFMFSGESRYIRESSSQATAQADPLPADEQTRKRACFEIVKAQDRAVTESHKRYPSDVMRQIDLERLLYDRYELPIFQKYGIAAARKGALTVQCARNNWIP